MHIVHICICFTEQLNNNKYDVNGGYCIFHHMFVNFCAKSLFPLRCEEARGCSSRTGKTLSLVMIRTNFVSFLGKSSLKNGFPGCCTERGSMRKDRPSREQLSFKEAPPWLRRIPGTRGGSSWPCCKPECWIFRSTSSGEIFQLKSVNKR